MNECNCDQVIALEKENNELKSHVDRLGIFLKLINDCEFAWSMKDLDDLIKETPKRSLAEHDTKVIERFIYNLKYDEICHMRILSGQARIEYINKLREKNGKNNIYPADLRVILSSNKNHH